ncbi:MAG: glycoside hydrolase family 78 protein [Kiritimatiellae bacterium]|nr:glycoside hydrolase family 78 protein [Kiritimatiellia bacterium]
MSKTPIILSALICLSGAAVGADWIAGAYEPPAEVQTNAFFAPARNPIVQKTFRARDGVKQAIWHVAAPGMRDLFVNGTRVTSTALPPWTPYRERVLEESFDVTAQVKSGADNVLVAELGNGWYNPLPLTMWYRYNLREALAIGTPCLRATLELAYADGTRESIPTDTSWRALEGKVVRNNLYLGVEEDGRLSVRETGPARVVKGPAGRICPAEDFPKVVIFNVRRPVSVMARPNGAYLVDFGANAAGTLRVTLRNVKAGQRVAFRQGERLFADGSLNPLTAVAGQIKKPERGPLFGVAEQCDSVICPEAREYVFEPRLAFHVFRYVQVEGLAAAPKPEDFEALDWSADVKEGGSFTSSCEKLNKLHEVCRRTFRSNLQSVQSDCPGREKFGYDGDVSCTAESFFCNYAMGPFYRKAVRDYLDEAAKDGLFTETAPFVGIASSGAIPNTRAAPIGWAAGVPVLLDVVVRYAGDLGILAEAYPALVRYLDILERAYPDHRIPKCLGDWIPVAGHKANESLSGNAHYHQFVKLTAKFARLLGKEADAARYAKLADEIAAVWRRDFHKGDGLVGRGVQGEQLFALYHGLLEAKDVPAAYARLKADIAARGDSLTTGIFGTQYLLEYLSTHGDAALAGRIVTHEGFPGWFDMMDRGATTLWEDWDERRCLDSHSNCHPMFGSCEQWFTRHVLGICVADDAVGCDRVRICPNAVAGLTSASGWLDTPKGRISVSWKLVDGKMQVEKSVPAGILIVD